MRASMAVLVIGWFLSSCGADSVRDPVVAEVPIGMTRFSDERRGFEVTFPSGWLRADAVLTPVLGGGRGPVGVVAVRGVHRP